MQLNYFCYYPHYFGDISGGAKIDAVTLAMLLTLSEAVGEGITPEEQIAELTLDELFDELDQSVKCTLVSDIYYDAKSIIRALKTKGFYAAEWEEGSFYICDDEHVAEAQAKLTKIERNQISIDFS